MTLWNFIKSKMELHLNQKVEENTACMTYEELIVFAENFGKKLQNFRCCAILCQSEMAVAMGLLSCLFAGVTAIPLSFRYGEIHCKRILNQIGPDAILTETDNGLEVIAFKDVHYRTPKIHPALIMSTSGTKGYPKGVMLTETNLITNITDIADYFHIENSDTILIARPLYHCAVLTGEFLTALIKGARIRFYSGAFRPSYLVTMLKEHKITAFCGTPTLLALMARFRRQSDTVFLKHIGISGECMGKEIGALIAKAFSEAEIYHVYGLTEACPRVAYLPPILFSEHSDCVGIPLKSVSLKVVTAEGKSAKTNEVGMLWVKGKNIMAGYYDDPEKTKEVLKNGWLCTGDLALFNEKGLLKIKGRADDLIIKAGMNIYPQEIERALRVDPRVKELSVYGAKDEKRGVQIVLNIAGDFSDYDEIYRLCKTYLPDYEIPNQINWLESLPKTASGKVLRR